MRKLISSQLMIFLLLGLLISMPASVVLAQSGTDVIREYVIDVQPQDNGDLINTYSISWCVNSDDAGPLGEIYVGMPNAEYEVLEYMGDAKDVQPANSGAYTQVLVRLDRYINADECVSFTFSVRQEGIAHLNENTGEVGFQFIPGWFDEVPVEKLKIIWNLPDDESLLKSIDPKPTSQEDGMATWESKLEEGDKYTINLLYDQSAFPNYGQESEVIWPLENAASDITNNTVKTSDAGTNNVFTDETLPASSSMLLFPSWAGVCVCAVILMIVIIVIVLISLSNGIRGYRDGGYIGGSRPTTGGGWILRGGGSSSSSSRSTPPSRSGGGGGLFGGRGSSCACVSCACACACAGGGRAGCSRKGFDISKLMSISMDGKQ